MRRSIRDIPGPIRILAGVSLVTTMGGSLMGPLVTLYVHDALGRSVAVAGLVLMFQGLAGILGQLAGGLAHDRLGGHRPLIGALAAAACVCGLLALTRSWAAYVILMVAFGFVRAVTLAPINALTSALWPGGGRRAFNVLYVVRNVGFATGAAVGGVAASRSFALAFALAAGAFVLAAAVVAAILPQPKEPLPVGRPLQAADPGAGRAPLRALASLGAGTILASAVYAQWSTTVAVYMGALGIPLSLYGLLWTLNGLGAVALQPLGNLAVRRMGPHLHRHLVLSAAMYALSFACLLLTRHLWGFVASIGLLTAGEIFDRPAWPAVMASLAPAGREGAYQGLLGTFQGAGRMLGPVAGGAAYDAYPPAAVWMGAAATALAAMVAYAGLSGTPARSRRRTRGVWRGSA